MIFKVVLIFEITANQGNLVILIRTNMTVTDKNLSHAVNNGYPPPSGNIHDIRVPVPGTSASDFEVKDTGKKKKGDSENVNWNLQLFKIHEDISAVEKQLKKEEMALSRHHEKNNKIASHFREKVEGIKAHLSRLHDREKHIQQKLRHSKNHKKLTVF